MRIIFYSLFILSMSVLTLAQDTTPTTATDSVKEGVIFCARKKDEYCQPYGMCCVKEVFSILGETIVSYYCEDPSKLDAMREKNLEIDKAYELYCAQSTYLTTAISVTLAILTVFMV